MQRLTVLSCAIMIAACGGSSPTDTNDDQGGGPNASFTAQMNDTTWSADTTIVTLNTSTPGALVIAGTDFLLLGGSKTITLNLAYLTGTGTVPLGVDVLTTAGGTGAVQIISGSTPTSYLTPQNGASGTLTVTSLTATRIVGTFQFVAPPTTAGGVTRTVTAGSLDVPLPTGFAVASTSDHGSRMSVNVDGAFWNAATVIGIGDLADGDISVGGTNTTYGVAITPNDPAAVGTMSVDAGDVTIVVQELGTSKFWGGAGSTGSVTFSSLANGYATGTFAATLEPSTGGATGTVTLTNGGFDVHITP